MTSIPETLSVELLFSKARTYHGWLDRPVDESVLVTLYERMKWGPTSTNCCPLRVVFLRSDEAKEKLYPCLMKANIEQTRQAPVTAILAYDTEFYTKLDILSPENKARTWFEGKESFANETARLNATLQGGYFILAARSCGLDCGPMSGFDAEKTDQVFFSGKHWKSLFLCNLGYGDPESLFPRGTRLGFDEACTLL